MLEICQVVVCMEMWLRNDHSLFSTTWELGTKVKVIMKKFEGKRKEQLFYQCMAKPGTGYHRLGSQ